MTSAAIVEQLVPTLYEDDHLLAVGKPAGIDATSVRPGIPSGLAELLGALRGQGESFQVTNLLSRYESGVLLLGKDPAIVRHIRTGLRTNRITMEYAAVVCGRMSQPQLVIDPAHGASRGQSAGPKSKKRKRLKPSAGSTSVDRQTVVRLVRAGRNRALVRCRTTVENPHALRAQLRAVGLRLLGDRLRDSTPQKQEPASTCLHLARIGFYHPGRKSKISITSREPSAFAAAVEDGTDVERPLLAALVRRLVCLTDPAIDSYRLLTGPVENVRGLVAEKFGDVVVLQILEDLPKLTESLRTIARWYQKTLGVRTVYAKRAAKADSTSERRSTPLSPPLPRGDKRGGAQTLPPSARGDERGGPPRPLAGKPVPPEIEITEGGLRYVIKPYEGASVGLFLDQRENRSRIRSMAAGKDVLNLFAYTCGFSVAAAVGGANSTVSVDLSPKHLEWGRANFAVNGIDLANHQFIKSDAADYLKRAKRQNRQFDIVILDPPSFAHGRKRKRSFSIVKDLPDLVAEAASLLRPEGTMMVSTNYRRLTLRRLRELIKQGAGQRRFKVTATPPLPRDFATDPDHAKTIFLQFA